MFRFYCRVSGRRFVYMIDYDDTGYTIRRDGAIKKRYTRTPADGKHKVQGADAHVLLAVDDIENLIGMEE